MQLYLDQQPKADYKFYCSLLGLPDDAKREAVLHSYVQTNIKEILVQDLPTFLLTLDFIVYLMVFSSFAASVIKYCWWLFEPKYHTCPNNDYQWAVLSGGVYFLLREVIQAYSFYSIKFFMTYLRNPKNYFDMSCIIIMFLWPIFIIRHGKGHPPEENMKEVFRGLSALAAGYLCIIFFSFLGQIFPHFSFIVRMSVLVTKKLYSFLLVLAMIITIFALMFYIRFIGEQCGQFCTFYDSWLSVYNLIFNNYGPDKIFGCFNTSNTTTNDPPSCQPNPTFQPPFMPYGAVIYVL